MENRLLLFSAVGILLLSIFLLWICLRTSDFVQKHPLLGNLRYKRLDPASPTRARLARASELFAKGWAVLKASDPKEAAKCLGFFAQAVEVDEMACAWKQDFEQKLEAVGSLFMVPTGSKACEFYSMLAEAYLVLLLYTVVALMGKPSDDAEEDYRVVKSRLDECVRMQPHNPVIYKLRGDWCGRFSAQADRDACLADFLKAVELCEADPEAKTINAHGADPKAMREHVLTCSHYSIGAMLQTKKEFKLARHHYEETVRHADADFVYLPDTLFNLSVLSLLVMEENSAITMLARSKKYYKDGSDSGRRLKRWFPTVTFDVAQKLANGLILKFSRSNIAEELKSASNKKSD